MADHRFDGWVPERLPSGEVRHRVRVEGNKRKRITIPFGPDHPQFLDHYRAARAGKRHEAVDNKTAPRLTLRWLFDEYLGYLEAEVRSELKSPLTLKMRRSQYARLCLLTDREGTPYGELHYDMPPAAFVRVRDLLIKTPAEADNTLKAVRAVYEYAIERRLTVVNPAKGITKIHISKGGAKPWTADDIKAFREAHKPGTSAHLFLTLLMFTGVRISDARILGRRHEVVRNGMVWLEFQPLKRGSALVSIPMLPPLFKATRAMKVQGETYMLSETGRPFGNMESMRERARKWYDAAGLTERSSHGVRKALAGLLAEVGCSTHQIGAILAHTKAQTTEIYTKDAERRLLAAGAMEALGKLDW